MSRREIGVNTLLGILLFLAFVGVGSLGLCVIEYLASRFLPSRVVPADLLLLLIYGISSAAYSVGHLRRKIWRNAFLCLAIIPVIVLISLGHPFSIFGFGGFISLWTVCILLFAPETSLVPRSEFFLAALIVSAVVVLASGIVGTAELSRIVSNCTAAAAIVLFVLQVRRRQAIADHDAAGPAIA
jgi:hypothetical protein